MPSASHSTMPYLPANATILNISFLLFTPKMLLHSANISCGRALRADAYCVYLCCFLISATLTVRFGVSPPFRSHTATSCDVGRCCGFENIVNIPVAVDVCCSPVLAFHGMPTWRSFFKRNADIILLSLMLLFSIHLAFLLWA